MDVVMPQLGETVTEGTVTKWHKKVGDAIRADEALFDVETDKVSTEIPAPASGVLAEILIAEGTTAKVGVRLAVIRDRGGATVPAPGGGTVTATPSAGSAIAATVQRPRPPRANARERLSPVVRKLIAEHGLDAVQISGSGQDGRVTRDDVLDYVAKRDAEQPAKSIVPAAAGAATILPLNSVQRRTADHMLRSWTTVPHVLQAVEVDFSRVDEARRAAGAQWKAREGYTLTYLPFIVRAVSIALGRHPNLNSTFKSDHLALHRRINIGIAVDLGNEGLIVPVVKDVATKSLPTVAREISDLATRARTSRLKPDELTEATYTITNNGAFGTLFTAPIINQSQVAILSTDAVRKKPWVIESPEGDTIAIRPVGMLAQTFDHRAVDGAYSAAFLREVKSIIETRVWGKELGDD